MRRENRSKKVQSKASMDKIILYVGIGVSILAIIAFALLMYSKDLSDDVKSGTMTLEEMANKASNTQSASTDKVNLLTIRKMN